LQFQLQIAKLISRQSWKNSEQQSCHSGWTSMKASWSTMKASWSIGWSIPRLIEWSCFTSAIQDCYCRKTKLKRLCCQCWQTKGLQAHSINKNIHRCHVHLFQSSVFFRETKKKAQQTKYTRALVRMENLHPTFIRQFFISLPLASKFIILCSVATYALQYVFQNGTIAYLFTIVPGL